MAYTRKAVISNATPEPDEVLVVFEDENGVLRNVLLRDVASLRADLEADRVQASDPAESTDPTDPVAVLPPDKTPLPPTVDVVFSSAEDAAFTAAESLITPPAPVVVAVADAPAQEPV